MIYLAPEKRLDFYPLDAIARDYGYEVSLRTRLFGSAGGGICIYQYGCV